MRALDDCKVVIYGTGGNGLGIAELLKSHVKIESFVDKRADEIVEINNIPVIKFDKLKEVKNKDNYIIFITIKNVFQHSEIAKKLLREGFSYLVYKPNNVLRGCANDVEESVNEIYEKIVERKQFEREIFVPNTKEIRYIFRNKLLIENEFDREVRVWCPVELLFNYRQTHDYPGLNMPLFFPLVDLYRYLLGETGEYRKKAIDNFIIYCCEWLKKNDKKLDESQKASFIESRVAVFQEMQKMAEVDTAFFEKNCPSVEYEDGKFYLSSSGRNRVSFLIAKGYKYVPVRMAKIDYDQWCEKDRIKEVEEYVSREDVGSFFAPKPNPYLVDYKVEFADYQRQVLWPIASEVMKEIYEKCRYTADTLICTNFDLVEIEKKNYAVDCSIDDDDIASQYFSSLGIGSENKAKERILITFDKIEDKSNRLWMLKEVYYTCGCKCVYVYRLLT